MKVLFTSPIIEHPPAGGPSLRIENSIKALARVSELFVVSRVAREAMGGIAADTFYKKFCKEWTYAPSARLSTNRYIRRIQKEINRISGVYADADFILRKIDEHRIDVLWFGYGCISFELIARIKALRPSLRTVCDTDSVWSRFILRELPLEKDPVRRARIERDGNRARLWEQKVVNLCEVTTAVSEVDAVYYRSIASDPGRIMMFSNVLDLETYNNIPAPVEGLKKPCCYLAGTFGHAHSPMDRAAKWMIEEILPLIRKKVPDIHLYLVGKDSEVLWGQLQDPGITVTGKVVSVLPYLCHVDVVVVPLQFESGTRFKIMEAGACCVPIVSTTLGAEGIPVTDKRDILLADTPADFAEAVVNLLKDRRLAGQLAHNCQELVRQHYSVDYLAREAVSILQKIATGG